MNLPLFVRGVPVAGKDESFGIDVKSEATVADLQESIANATGITTDFAMSVGGQPLHDPDAMLADLGVMAEAVIQLHQNEPHFIQMQKFLASLENGNGRYQALERRLHRMTEEYQQTGIIPDCFETNWRWADTCHATSDAGYRLEDGRIVEIRLHECGLEGVLDLARLP